MPAGTKRPASKARRFHRLLEGDVSDSSPDMIEWRTPAAPRRNLGFAPPKPPAPRKKTVEAGTRTLARRQVMPEVEEPIYDLEREERSAVLDAPVRDEPPDDGEDQEEPEDAVPMQDESDEEGGHVPSSEEDYGQTSDHAYAEESMYAADSDIARAAYSSRNATPGKPFGCSEPHCKKTFTRRGDLLRHYRIHTEDR